MKPNTIPAAPRAGRPACRTMLAAAGAAGLAAGLAGCDKPADNTNQPPPVAPPVAIAPPPSATPVVPCAKPPKNGQVLTEKVKRKASGHTIEIVNGGSGNAIVKLRDATTRKTMLAFYAEKAKTATLERVPDGTYEIQYAVGDTLDTSCEKFIDGFANKFPALEKLARETFTDERGTGVRWQVITFTLETTVGGNVKPEAVAGADFDAE